MQTRSSDENSVCPSVRLYVRLFVKRVICDETKESCARIFISHARTFTLVLWQEEWLVGRPILPEILGQIDTVGAKSRFSVDIRS